MVKRSAGVLEVKPLYTVAELAAAAGVTPRAMALLLRRRRVQITRGRTLVVTLIDLREGWPSLIESLQMADAARGWADVA